MLQVKADVSLTEFGELSGKVVVDFDVTRYNPDCQIIYRPLMTLGNPQKDPHLLPCDPRAKDEEFPKNIRRKTFYIKNNTPIDQSLGNFGALVFGLKYQHVGRHMECTKFGPIVMVRQRSPTSFPTSPPHVGSLPWQLNMASFTVDDDPRCYIKDPMTSEPDLPIFFKDTHKSGYIEVALDLLDGSGHSVRNWLESGQFYMNVCDSNGNVVPFMPSPVERDVEVSVGSIMKRGNSSKANDPIRTVLNYFDSSDAGKIFREGGDGTGAGATSRVGKGEWGGVERGEVVGVGGRSRRRALIQMLGWDDATDDTTSLTDLGGDDDELRKEVKERRDTKMMYRSKSLRSSDAN
ncbi:hypothetical protein TrRE_jg1323, partial [Triparma retinervis]